MAILKTAFIIMGIVFLLMCLNAYVRQKLTDEMALCWGGFSIFLFLMGISMDTHRILSTPLFVICIICFIIVLMMLFLLCTTVSVLIMKNRELAMQVSLLNQENERMLHELGIIPDGEEEAD